MLISTNSSVTIEIGKDVTEDNLQYWIETHTNYVDTVVIVGKISKDTIQTLESAFEDKIAIA